MGRPTAILRALFGKAPCVAVLVWSIAASAVEAEAANRAAEVLVLHATSRDGVLAVTADREIPKVLAAALDRPLDYYPEYLDTARFQDSQYQNSFLKFVALKYRHHRFDLVLSLGSTPLTFAERIRHELSPDAPLAFYAYNQPRRRPSNSTGVYSVIDLASTLRLATTLQPDVAQVFVVTGSSDQDRYYESAARAQFRSFEALSFTYLSGLTMDELERRLKELPAHSIVYYVALFRDRAGTNFAAIPVVARIVAAASAPVYSWQASTLDYGVVGGTLAHAEVPLDALAKRAAAILRGERADSIPTETPATQYVDEVDWRALQRWRIPEKRVPAGTRVDFREPGAWDRYRRQIIGATAVVVGQMVLIAVLLVQRRRRRRAECRAIDSEAQLQMTCTQLREMGNRLISAQETERSRIARELHDDLSQQAALLAIHLGLLRETNLPATPSTLVNEACAEAAEIASGLRNLSHRLHPAKLRLLGLVPALTGLRRELETAGTTIAFRHDAVPERLPFDLTLCFFRIAQEAIQNAITHGSASHVSIYLSGRGKALALKIADNGVGFDVDAAWGKGLGLVSIAERLDFLGGRFVLRSRVGHGTFLEVVVPLAPWDAEANVA